MIYNYNKINIKINDKINKKYKLIKIQKKNLKKINQK